MTGCSISLIVALAIVANDDDTQRYTKAREVALTSSKPLVVFVGADWCQHCATMREQTMAELRKQGDLERVEYVYIEQTSAIVPALTKDRSIPQLLMYHKTAKGWKRMQLNGLQSADRVKSFLNHGAPPMHGGSTKTSWAARATVSSN